MYAMHQCMHVYVSMYTHVYLYMMWTCVMIDVDTCVKIDVDTSYAHLDASIHMHHRQSVNVPRSSKR